MTTAPTGVDPGVVTISHPVRTAGNGAAIKLWTRTPRLAPRCPWALNSASRDCFCSQI